MDRVESDNPIGQYLRARRQLVRPEDLGLAPGVRRRVPGLRREEVAMLAGVSTDYYVRLEQGRERRPSAQVVDAIARALVLDEEATAYLRRLAAPAPRRRRRAGRNQRVSDGLLRIMAGWQHLPAVILGPYLDVLAHNDLGRALFAGHTYSDDLMRLVFLDPDAREFYVDWDRAALNAVAALRAAAGDADDPSLTRLVGELSLRSEPFRRLWARHDIGHKTHETKRLRHPLVGELTLSYETLTVNGTPDQQLVVYHAEPGSPSAEALALLGSLAAESSQDAGQQRHPAGRPPRPRG
ncbi:helix-turn-helix domain-containing protein [Streptomyces sp. NPDC090994]|uniref:helix-turn-helix domain-containing protein n=1 Tax=Streptomyces sp. NPDC090994 TaxID=3365969 RepID=UPI0037F7FDAD